LFASREESQPVSSRTIDRVVDALAVRWTRRQVAGRCGGFAAGTGLATGLGLGLSEMLVQGKKKKRCRATRKGNTVTVENFGGRFVCADEDPERAARLQLAGTQCTGDNDPVCKGGGACGGSESCLAIAKATSSSEVRLVDGAAGSVAECPDEVPVAAQLSGQFTCVCACVG
jgi:hypothetical protein